jgi:hypothetical protein
MILPHLLLRASDSQYTRNYPLDEVAATMNRISDPPHQIERSEARDRGSVAALLCEVVSVLG